MHLDAYCRKLRCEADGWNRSEGSTSRVSLQFLSSQTRIQGTEHSQPVSTGKAIQNSARNRFGSAPGEQLLLASGNAVRFGSLAHLFRNDFVVTGLHLRPRLFRNVGAANQWPPKYASRSLASLRSSSAVPEVCMRPDSST